MGVLTHVRKIYIAMTEPKDTYVPVEMSDKERDAILKSDEGYKEFIKTDSKVKSSEKSVEDYTNIISKMGKTKKETLDIGNVMTANRRAAMMKYHPETKPKNTKKESKSADIEIGD